MKIVKWPLKPNDLRQRRTNRNYAASQRGQARQRWDEI